MATPTLILDGFLGRPGRWMRLARLIEQRTDSGATLFRYDSTGRQSLPTLGRKLADAVAAVGGPVNLVGFSMGGLVIRAAKLLEPTLPLHRAVFINSPHRGTWLAHLWPLPGVRQMRPRDAFQATLAAAAWDVPTLVVYNRFDGIVFPAVSTRYAMAGCEHWACPVPMHVWPVWSRRTHRRVADFLGERAKVIPEPACPSM